MASSETPLMKQYYAIKAKYPGAMLLFRVGDFYELFGEDAGVASKILNITLTKRSNGAASEMALAGFPHHALDNYLPKLVRAGKRVAICDQLENPKNNLATEIISSDDKTLGKFYLNDNRTPVDYSELPQNLVDALIATEDARFRDHSGIDARGTLRAIFKLGSGGGASTISQQLAKNLFHGEGSKNIIERVLQNDILVLFQL